MMPTFLGAPFYPCGFPVPAKDIRFHSKGSSFSIEEIKLKFFEDNANEEDLTLLKEYVVYYACAPCFLLKFENNAQEENFKKNMSLDDMLDLLLDAGLDPL